MSFDQMNKTPSRHQVSQKELKADADRISRLKQSQQIQNILDTIKKNQLQMDQNRQKKVTANFNKKNKNISADQFNEQNQRLSKIRSNPLIMLGQMAGKPMAYTDMSKIFGATAAPGHSNGLNQKQLRMQEVKAQLKQLGAAGKPMADTDMGIASNTFGATAQLKQLGAAGKPMADTDMGIASNTFGATAQLKQLGAAGKPMAYTNMSNIFGATAAPGHSIGLYQKQLRMQEAKAQLKQLGAAENPMADTDLGIINNIFGAAAAPGHSIGLYQKQLRMQEAKARSKQLGVAGKAYRTTQMMNTALAMGSSGSYLGAALGLKIPSFRSKMTRGIGETMGFSSDKFVSGKAGTNLLSGQWGQSAGDIASNVGLGGIGQSIGSGAGSIVGGLGGAMSPAMLAGIALPIALSISTSMLKSKKQNRLRGEPPVISDIIQQYSRTKGIMQQTMLLLRSGEVKPGEALMIQVSKITADNTGALLAMYEIMKMEEEHKTKDAVTSVDFMEDEFKDKNWIESGFDKLEAGFQKFSMKYNPLAQLGAAIGGKTPKQVIDEINEGQQKDVKEEALAFGTSPETIRRAQTDANTLMKQASSPEGKKAILAAGLYDINRYMLQELMLIRKYGHNIDEQGLDTGTKIQTGWEVTSDWFQDLKQSIPLLTASINTLSISYKTSKGLVKLIGNVVKPVSNFIQEEGSFREKLALDWKETKDKYLGFFQKSVDKELRGFGSDYEKIVNNVMGELGFNKPLETLALEYQANGFPTAMDTLIQSVREIGEDTAMAFLGQRKVHDSLIWDPVGGTYVKQAELQRLNNERTKLIEESVKKQAPGAKWWNTFQFKGKGLTFDESQSNRHWMLRDIKLDKKTFNQEDLLKKRKAKGFNVAGSKSERHQDIVKIVAESVKQIESGNQVIESFNDRKLFPHFDNDTCNPCEIIDTVITDQIETINRVAELQQRNQREINAQNHEDIINQTETIDRVAELQQRNQREINAQMAFRNQSLENQLIIISDFAKDSYITAKQAFKHQLDEYKEKGASTFAKEKAEYAKRKMIEAQSNVFNIIKEYLPKMSDGISNFAVKFKDNVKTKAEGILGWLFDKMGLTGIFGSTIGLFLWKYIKKIIKAPFKEIWSAFKGIFFGSKGIITRIRLIFRKGIAAVTSIFSKGGIASTFKSLFSLKSLKTLFGFKSIMRLFSTGVKRNPITGIIFGAIDAVIDMWRGFKKGGIKGLIKGMFSVDKGGGFWSALKASSKYGFWGATIGFLTGGPPGLIAGFGIGSIVGGIIGWIGGENWSKIGNWIGGIFESIGEFFKDMYPSETTIKFMKMFGDKVPILGHIFGYMFGSTITLFEKIFSLFNIDKMYEKVKQWIAEEMPWPFGSKKPPTPDDTQNKLTRKQLIARGPKDGETTYQFFNRLKMSTAEARQYVLDKHKINKKPVVTSYTDDTQNKLTRKQLIARGPKDGEKTYQFFDRLKMSTAEVKQYTLDKQKINKKPVVTSYTDDITNTYNKLKNDSLIQKTLNVTKKFTNDTIDDIKKNKDIIAAIQDIEDLKIKIITKSEKQIEQIRNAQITKDLTTNIAKPLINELKTISSNIIESANATMANTGKALSQTTNIQRPTIEPQIKQSGEESYGSIEVDNIIKELFKENVIGLPERIVAYTLGSQNLNV